jgi:hypothetical protein
VCQATVVNCDLRYKTNSENKYPAELRRRSPLKREFATAVISWEDEMRYALLWLIGVPIPVLLVLYLLFH